MQRIVKATLAVLVLLSVGLLKTSAQDTDTPKINWGDSASGLKAGFSLAKSASDASKGYTCMLYVQGETNRSLTLPVKAQAMEVHLIDPKGKECKRGKAGRGMGEKLQLDKELLEIAKNVPGSAYVSQSRLFPIEPGIPTKVDYFRIMDYFKVSEPGDYRLVVELRFIERSADGTFSLIQLPPIAEKLKVETQDLE